MANDEGGSQPGESEKERIDRELIELLNELRVTLPGVQVLFAFLLILPFQNGWQKVTALQKDVYFLAFLCATVASICLIAPTANHRIQFRQGKEVKERLLFRSNHLTIVGTAFLSLAMTLTLFLVTDVLFAGAWAASVAAVALFLLLVLWYVMPAWTRIRHGRDT